MSESHVALPDRRPLTLALTVGQRSRNVTALAWLIGLAGMAGSGLALLEQFAHGTPGHAAAIAGTSLTVCVFVALGLTKAGPAGRLELDDDGSARWTRRPAAHLSKPHSDPHGHDREGSRFFAGPFARRARAPVSGCSVAPAPGQPFLPKVWFSFAGIIWLTGHCEGQVVRLILGKDRLTDAEALRLQRWMRWLDRGGHTPA